MVKDMILHHREELKRQAAESNNEEDDEIKDDFTIGSLLHNIGNICMFQGDYRRSRRYFREALAVRAKSSNERDSDIVVRRIDISDAKMLQPINQPTGTKHTHLNRIFIFSFYLFWVGYIK
jgi:hypothetical protein